MVILPAKMFLLFGEFDNARPFQSVSSQKAKKNGKKYNITVILTLFQRGSLPITSKLVRRYFHSKT